MPGVNLTATLRLKDQLSKQLKTTQKSVGSSLGLMAKSFAAVGAAAVFVRLADDMIVLQNRLKAVTGSAEEAQSAFEGLSDISVETRSSIASNAQAFQRFTIATKSMGLAQSDVLDLTRQLNLAIKLSGTTAKEANAGMIQFAQGLGSGALRGDELRSVLEQMPVVARVIAEGFNIPINRLKELGEQGKLTAVGIVKAFSTADAELTKTFKKLKPTVGDSLTVAFDQFKILVGEVDALFGISGAIATMLRALTEAIQDANATLKILVGELPPGVRREREASGLRGGAGSRPGDPGISGRPRQGGLITRADRLRALDIAEGIQRTIPLTMEDLNERRRIIRERTFVGPPNPFPLGDKGNLEIPRFGRADRLSLEDPNVVSLGIEILDPLESFKKLPELTTDWQEALKSVKEEFSGLNIAISIVGGAADSLINNISGGLVAMTTGAKTAKEAFTDMAKSILADLQRIIIQALIAKALGALIGSFAGPAGSASPTIQASGASATSVFGVGASAGIGSFTHGGFVKPGQVVQATLHGGKFGETIIPNTGRFDAQSAVGSGGGGTTITYNIQAIDVEDFDNKILASIARRDGEVSSIVAARSRNSGVLRGAFGIG